MFRSRKAALSLVCWFASAWCASAFTIELDYSYDANHFFTGANMGRQSYLKAAATALSSRITDDLLAITESGSNVWTAIFPNPATGAEVDLNKVSIAADTVRIYVGARNLGSGTLGVGGPGGYSASGSQAWLNTLNGRGEAGAQLASPTDFGPWGGALTFDLATNWYFDTDVSTMESIGAKSDFYSVALHEMGHVLGIGTADSWFDKIVNGKFQGSHAVAVHGGAVTVDSDGGHWLQGISGHLEGSNTPQEADMDPSLLQGTRKYFTDLDFAGLADVGWQIKAIPEPGSAGLCACGLVLLAARRRRE